MDASKKGNMVASIKGNMDASKKGNIDDDDDMPATFEFGRWYGRKWPMIKERSDPREARSFNEDGFGEEMMKTLEWTTPSMEWPTWIIFVFGI